MSTAIQVFLTEMILVTAGLFIGVIYKTPEREHTLIVNIFTISLSLLIISVPFTLIWMVWE